jgi:hypothetical protein
MGRRLGPSCSSNPMTRSRLRATSDLWSRATAPGKYFDQTASPPFGVSCSVSSAPRRQGHLTVPHESNRLHNDWTPVLWKGSRTWRGSTTWTEPPPSLNQRRDVPRREDIVLLDDLQAHKDRAVRFLIEQCGDRLKGLPPNMTFKPIETS